MTVAIVPEDVLGAVAVVDVEIDDRDALDAMGRLGVAGGDRGVVEEAEAHRRRRFGVVAGRPRGDEGVVDAPARSLRRPRTSLRPPSAAPPPACPATSRCRSRAGSRPGSALALLDRLDVVERMDARQRLDRDARRAARAREAGTFRLRAPDRRRAVARGRSGWPSPMSWRGARRMRHQQRRQRTGLSRMGVFGRGRSIAGTAANVHSRRPAVRPSWRRRLGRAGHRLDLLRPPRHRGSAAR